jgi:hypothetical protein
MQKQHVPAKVVFIQAESYAELIAELKSKLEEKESIFLKNRQDRAELCT